jgi:phytanoyl-CoA hydroxylase
MNQAVGLRSRTGEQALLVKGTAGLDVARALEEFQRLGYARLGPVLSEEGRALLGQRLEDLMLARVRVEGLFFQRDAPTGRYEDLRFGLGWQGPSLEYRKIEKLERDPLFRAFIENPLFERIARAQLGDAVALYRAVVFTKSASGGSALPWHQDGGDFWGVDRAPTLQIWTSFDDAPVESGCVEVVPGSHLRGLATPKGGTIPDALLTDDLREGRVLPLPARAGEALLIHNHLWHRSLANTTGRRRSALSVCYMSAATRCLRKRRAPREFVRLFMR